ncbi:MAG: hypothetical protein HC919_00035 [Oscillatoriales cyanobacterium SM2_2_1]|nr:hypothetical protein [Oscillatoriales cyanobacterium SM2_2_1]
MILAVIAVLPIIAVLPLPNAQGDYLPPIRRTPVHRLWQVVDRDPAGLNCRMAAEFPPGTLWFETARGQVLLTSDRHPIGQWPVVATLKRGAMVQAFSGNLGAQLIIRDRQKKPWLPVLVERSRGGVHCFVRANSKLIQPAGKETRF